MKTKKTKRKGGKNIFVFLCVILLMLSYTVPVCGQGVSALLDAIKDLEKKLTKTIKNEAAIRKAEDNKIKAIISKEGGSNTASDSSTIVLLKKIEGELNNINSSQAEFSRTIAEIEKKVDEVSQKGEDARVVEMAEGLKKLIEELKNTMKINTEEEKEEKEEKRRINLTGLIDTDVWCDMHGNFGNNDDNTIVMEANITDNVTGYFGITVIIGTIPAGGGEPEGRWPAVAYDGAWLSWNVTEGFNLTAGDILYRYGVFNYYLFKFKSMITPECFLRGLQVTKELGPCTFDLLTGVKDANNMIGYALSFGIAFNDNHSLTLYDIMDFDQKSESKPLAIGLEYCGEVSILSLKLNIGVNKDLGSKDSDAATTVLFEPSISITDNFSIAASVYFQKDDGYIWGSPMSIEEQEDNTFDTTGASRDFGDFFFYIEPGYSFNEHIAFGLPVEYHDDDLKEDDDASFWLVPTLYVYPFENFEWWIWGQMVKSIGNTDEEAEFYIGSEVIFSF